jgi:aspartokinase-like uncharacterized kinase
VLKLGGSLIGWEGLPSRLANYLSQRAGERLVVITGGGAAADLVRSLDHLYALGEERAHALALCALDFTAHLAASLIETLSVADHPRDFPTIWGTGRTPVLAPRCYLEEDEAHRRRRLPRSWDVTSDSIAARLAERLGADELVLLKSAPLPRGANRVVAAQLGLVDPQFPKISSAVGRVVYINLREPEPRPAPL